MAAIMETDCFDSEQFSAVIDVRSPSEYAIDVVPGACNLPVLYDTERELVGRLYRDDTFAARRTGAALVAENIAGHLRAGAGERRA